MSFIKKMKDILFDEEEVVESVPKKKETIKVEAVKVDPPVVEKIKVPEEPKKMEDTKEMPSPFIDFDEDEFSNSIPHVPSEPKKVESRVKPEVSRSSVYNNYERKTVVEKKVDYGRYEKIETVETKEKIKFKPSLIISPVYGVLNEDYTPDDIKSKEEVMNYLDIDEVRKKAYGDLDKLEQTIDEPVETFFEEKVKISVSSAYEPEEDVKSIDELLSISADEKIEVDETKYDLEEEFSVTEEIKIPKSRRKKEHVEIFEEEEDTLESDLFDLIDSMYESKEEVL